MSSVVVVGAQWGNEGKGKITDLLNENAEVITRYQGGDSAGRTVRFNDITYKLHLIPSRIFYKEKVSVINSGIVVNPRSLVKELAYLKENNTATDSLRISDRTHVILSYHIKLDQLQKDARGGNKIGTTIKGIGPAYMGRAARVGIRITDLLDKETFTERLKASLEEENRRFVKILDSEAIKFDDTFEGYYRYGQQIKQYVIDTLVILDDALDTGKRVSFEGARGVTLGIDQGTYPFVTSSNPVAGGVTIDSGVSPSEVDKVVGVCKAYTSRVDGDPFPIGLFDETGETIRHVSKEYGATTGRPRRVSWPDSVVMHHSKHVSGITNLSLSSINMLNGLGTVKVCMAYELDGKLIYHYPTSLKELSRCKPVYEELPGWSEDVTSYKTLAGLPANARNYVHRISELVGVRISTFSVGPGRNQTNVLESVQAQI